MSTKNKLFIFFAVINVAMIARYFITRESGNEPAAEQEVVAEEPFEQVDNNLQNETFRAYLSKFPTRSLPTKFPTNGYFDEGSLSEIETQFAEQFLSPALFTEGYEKTHYLAALKVNPGVYSVVVYQQGEQGREQYVLINYNAEGKILSGRTIAEYSTAAEMTGESIATIDKNQLEIVEVETGRSGPDSREEKKFSFTLTKAGAILPAPLPQELMTVFHRAVIKENECLIAPVYTQPGKKSSEAFRFYMQGDTIIFHPSIHMFDINSPDEYYVIVDSYAKIERGYYITLKDENVNHDRYDDLTHVNLIASDDQPGMFSFVFTQAHPDRTILINPNFETVVAKANLSDYKTRNLKYVHASERIKYEGSGIPGYLVGYDAKDPDDFAKEYNLTFREDPKSNDRPVRIFRFYDENNEQLIEVEVNNNGEVGLVNLFDPRFKTDGLIGVGSSLGDVLYGHENVSAICGETALILSIPDYVSANFIIEVTACAPDESIDLHSLDKNLKIARIEFRP